MLHDISNFLSNPTQFASDSLAAVWRACWQSTLIYLFVAIVVFAFRNRIAPRWQFIMWSLVLCRLILVVTPPSQLSAFNWLPWQTSSPETAAVRSVASNLPDVGEASLEPAGRDGVAGTWLGAAELAENQPPAEPLARRPPKWDVAVARSTKSEVVLSQPGQQRFGTFIFLGWLAGFAIFTSPLVVAWLRLRRKLADCEEASDAQLCQLFSEVCNQWRFQTRPKLLILQDAISPFVVGILRPRIVLPALIADRMSSDQLKCILAHELAHVRRRDVLLQWIVLMVRSVYWFHPCAWLAGRQMQLCREAACDDVAARNLDQEARRQYGLAMLGLVRDAESLRLATSFCGLFGTAGTIRYRIQRLASAPNNSRLANLTAILLVIGVVVLGLTDAIPEAAVGATRPGQTVATSQQSSSTFDARETIEFAGTCISWTDQSPLAGVELTLFEVRGIQKRIRKLKQTTTDADGAYAFGDLPATDQRHLSKLGYLILARAAGRPDVLVPMDYNTDRLGWSKKLMMHEGTGSIKGKVTDEQGNPVAGALVQRALTVSAVDVGIATFETNEEGLFILKGMPLIDGKRGSARGAYLQIFHADYPMMSFQRKTLDYSTFVMKTGCAVQGTVVDAETQRPMAGVALSAVPAEARSEARQAHATTDEAGRFRMVLIEGIYNLNLEEDEQFVAASVPLKCRAGATLDVGSMQAVRGGWIVGQVINTQSGLPQVIADRGDGQLERVALGFYGPSRPKGNVLHTHFLAEVDDDGRFRMRAYPGENYPYLANLRGSRMIWNTSKQPPTVVEAGKETECQITFTPPLTPQQKMAKAREVLAALPTEMDERIAGIVEEFRKLNHTVDECEVWCLLMQEIVRIGKPAVPALCQELEATDEQRMMRRLAFALRAIGDPRAVPTLIRVLPKTLQPPMSDYGLLVDDPDLTTFMQEHDLDARARGSYFGLGRPIREVFGALNKLTRRGQNVKPLSSISRSKDLRSLDRQEKIYHEAARQWAIWWEKNWQQVGVEDAYSQVNLPHFQPRDLSNYPTGLELTPNASVASGRLGQVLTPIGDEAASADFFMDLDSQQDARWPPELIAKDDSQATIQAARNWASKRGFDLMCVAAPQKDETTSYLLVGIDLELWEIDNFDAKNIGDLIEAGKLPAGRKLESAFLLHRDEKSQRDTSALKSSFLYLTKDQGLGVITLTDFVTEAKDITGMFSVPKGVGFYRGVRFDTRPIAR